MFRVIKDYWESYAVNKHIFMVDGDKEFFLKKLKNIIDMKQDDVYCDRVTIDGADTFRLIHKGVTLMSLSKDDDTEVVMMTIYAEASEDDIEEFYCYTREENWIEL